MIGLGGLGAEVCKDIVLAGIKSLTIIDSQRESEENVGNRFLYFAEGIPVSHKNNNNYYYYYNREQGPLSRGYKFSIQT